MSRVLRIGEAKWDLGKRTRLVGILNATPDSFYDGGAYDAVPAAVERAIRMAEEGADIVDIGGESTRPGHTPVAAAEETRRVLPIIEALAKERNSLIISVDTSKGSVAEAALCAGARVVNDIWGFQRDPRMAEVAAASEATCILMSHLSECSAGDDPIQSVFDSWKRSLELAADAGVDEERIVLDPGIGFTPSRDWDLAILRGLDRLRDFGFPVLLGASRKRITASPLGYGKKDRLETTLVTSVAGVAQGIDFLRVHDVLENRRCLAMADLIYRSENDG